MKFFLDTASLKDISWAAQAGLIDGVTTNPSLLAKQAGDLDPKDVLKEICSLVDGPVSAEFVGLPPDVLKKLLLHPLTDRGLEQFLADWNQRVARAKAAV